MQFPLSNFSLTEKQWQQSVFTSRASSATAYIMPAGVLYRSFSLSSVSFIALRRVEFAEQEQKGVRKSFLHNI